MSVWWEDWAEKGGKGANHRVHGMADMTFAFFPFPTDLRVQLLKHTKHDIVHAFCALPKTQHDFSSFVVDMCFQTVNTAPPLVVVGGWSRKPHHREDVQGWLSN